MKQVVQDLRNGKISLLEVPAPAAEAHSVVIRSQASVLSAGTERMLLEFGKAGLISKSRKQPDKVRDALLKVKTDGLPATIDAIRTKLDQPLPLGYCNAGRVLSVGRSVTAFKPGDLVSCNGPHAEIVRVPQNLCVHVPEGVGADSAAFAPLGAVALESLRLAAPELGEQVVVSGLGLVGLLCVQLLLANGCRVIGVDKNPKRLALAEALGAGVVHADADPVSYVMTETRGQGADAAIIAVATESSEPVHHAARMCRTRGRIVLVGVSGLNLSRGDFQAKELSFQVSNSYGPGRYDPEFESGRRDYPAGYLRWTAQRNMEAFLSVLATGRVNMGKLISHRVPFADTVDAYALLLEDKDALGIVLEYPTDEIDGEIDNKIDNKTHDEAHSIACASVTLAPPARRRDQPSERATAVDVIGAGNYGARMLLPALRASGSKLGTLVSTGSVASVHHARRFGFAQATTDLDGLFDSERRNAVVIATRHNSHADLTCRALDAGRDVFVEKPLATRQTDLDRIVAAHEETTRSGHEPILMVGFNRRFAPAAQEMRRWLAARREAAAFIYTVNAGSLPEDHWLLDPNIGGGRLVSEACHFIDLLRYLAGCPISACSVSGMGGEGSDSRQETATICLRFSNGASGAIHYLANGSRAFPKERLEVFIAGHVLALDNFRRLRGYGGDTPKQRLWRQDKGHEQCIQAYVDAINGKRAAPIPLSELIEVSRVAIIAQEQLRCGDSAWHVI